MHILTASSCSALGLSVRNLNAAVSAVDVVWILAKSSPNKSSRLAQASPLTHQPRDPRNPSFLAFLPPSSHQACVSKPPLYSCVPSISKYFFCFKKNEARLLATDEIILGASRMEEEEEDCSK